MKLCWLWVAIQRLLWRPSLYHSIDRVCVAADRLKGEIDANPGTLRAAVEQFAERL